MCCKKCCGIKKIVFGVLLLLNAYGLPGWIGIDGWVKFVAVLMVIYGVLKLVLPSCKDCASESYSIEKKSKK